MAETTKKIRTRQYEGMFLFGAGALQELNGAQATVRGIIEKYGGEILVLKKWDERKLAYETNKQKRGVYIIAYFKAPTTALTSIERDVKLSEEVLRVLITDAEHLNKTEMEAVEPQPIIRQETPSWERGNDRFDRPAGDRPQGDRPAGDRPQGDRPQGDRPAGDRPARGPRREDAPVEAGAAKD